MTRSAILNGRLYDPASGLDKRGNLYIDGDRLVGVGEQPPSGFVADQEINVDGLWVLPGLFDLYACLRQPGFEHKGTFASELRAAVKGGVTSVCCPPNTSPVNDSAAVSNLINDLARETGLSRVYALGAITQGLSGEQLSEMYALKAAGCIGVTNLRRPFRNNKIMKRCLEYACSHDITVFACPEDAALAQDGCVHEGAIASRLGLAGIPASAETLAVSQWLMLAEDTDVRLHLGPLSCARSVELVREAKQRGLKVTANVALANLMFTEACIEDFDSRFHVRPPLRREQDRQALLDGLREGVLDVIVSKHEPHEIAALLAPFAETEPGMSQLETWLSQMLLLSRESQIDFGVLLAASTVGPARVSGLGGGALKVGELADFSVFDPNAEWTPTAVQWMSAGKNSPWLDRTLPGVVTMTWVGGKNVYPSVTQ
ncbi:MAG: dihydroorotase [Hahellaceae bacterium]|jgi:dihydroorotase|nr:dihydroorotase [Hahellaceae bacterium]